MSAFSYTEAISQLSNSRTNTEMRTDCGITISSDTGLLDRCAKSLFAELDSGSTVPIVLTGFALH